MIIKDTYELAALILLNTSKHELRVRIDEEIKPQLADLFTNLIGVDYEEEESGEWTLDLSLPGDGTWYHRLHYLMKLIDYARKLDAEGVVVCRGAPDLVEALTITALIQRNYIIGEGDDDTWLALL